MSKASHNIPAIEDRIPGGLQHCHKMCYKKGGCHGRQACMIWRWFHCGDVISRQVDLYITEVPDKKHALKRKLFVEKLWKLSDEYRNIIQHV